MFPRRLSIPRAQATVAGAFLRAIGQGKSYQEAAAFANKAASVLVSSFGARLPIQIVKEKLVA
ncbi:MAG: hypothetical protein U5O39_02810 [Gammaproteobacteria bacterium]|nr:hypothetical protein [Gammaproteobacteria bacterium]